MGLYLNDLNVHGLSREMVLTGWQHGSRYVVYFPRFFLEGNQVIEVHDYRPLTNVEVTYITMRTILENGRVPASALFREMRLK